MGSTARARRRALFGAFAAMSAGGAAVVALSTFAAFVVPSATAAPDPCAASQVAKTLGVVATSTGNYLDAHPQTNQALTTLSQQQPGPQSLGALKNYFDANPQAGADIQQLQQPLVSLSSRCKLPLTLPQLMGLMQAAQQGGGASTSLPGGLSGAQSVGLPAASAPTRSAVTSSAAQDTRVLPGPPITGLP
jgi:hemophore